MKRNPMLADWIRKKCGYRRVASATGSPGPCEQVVPEDVGPDGSIKCYRDAEGVHHVPKRALAELLLLVN